jgi:hypothetical protein
MRSHHRVRCLSVLTSLRGELRATARERFPGAGKTPAEPVAIFRPPSLGFRRSSFSRGASQRGFHRHLETRAIGQD